MKKQHSLTRSFHLKGGSILLLLLFGWLTAARAVAAPSAAGPLPLPDLLIYGTVTNATGDPRESGTIKALLNGQTLASAPIAPIGGTDYTYLLAVPMGMVAPGSTNRDSRTAIVGDVLTFTVDDKPAYYQDPFTSLTVNQLRVPSGAAGSSVVLDLSLPDAMRYLVGDVNANGARNATDAMLTLKYDIGLIVGVTTFPPGPNTVYLPLCDVVENGRCDSSDALRILQCDAGLHTVTCPVETIPAVEGAGVAGSPAQNAQTPSAPSLTASGDTIALRIAAAEVDDVASMDVSLLLTAGADRFGASSFELHYDPALLTPTACAANPGEAFDMVVCNLDYAPGIVRFNAVSASGVADNAALATLRFLRTDVTAQTPPFTLTADNVTDVDGAGLDWRVETTDAPEAQMPYRLFLPAVGSSNQRSTEQSPQGTQHWLFLPAVGGSNQRSTEQSPQGTPYRLFLPAVSGQFGQVMESGVEMPTADGQPPAEPAPMGTPEPTATPTGAPSPIETPAPTETPAAQEMPTPEKAITPVNGPTAEPATPPIKEATPEASVRVAMAAVLPATRQPRARSGSAVRR